MTLTDPYAWESKVRTLEAELKNVYRERHHLVAFLSALYPASLSHTDPSTPDYPVATVQTPAGQMSWHVHPDDTDLFPHLDPDAPAFAWDGHSTEEKYARLQQLTADVHAAANTPQEAPAPQPVPEGPQETPQAPQEPAGDPQGAADTQDDTKEAS